ncbi:hypothetical protein GDO86_012729 [Hymenochirus boettgeri]|uniref:Uncharacterized protein n=1 Tax=Hymenochirus boettgeri TaxID=247094 RepID=A0A8T2IR52_9PIPI|nr:hypothetical protein GDO86_012729 [Hymenochirus boettgeri]
MALPTQKYSDCQNKFDARKYLEVYYGVDPLTQQIDEESQLTLAFLVKVFSSGAIQGDSMIEIGSGPVLHHILSACDRFKSIYLTDYLDVNLQEIDKWLKGSKDAFDWTPYLKYVCEVEGNRSTPKDKVLRIKNKVKLMRCDVTKSNPLEPHTLPQTDCVIAAGCLICACKTLDAFSNALKNIASLIRRGGHVIIIDYLGASYYLIGDAKMNLLSINENIVKREIIDAGFEIDEFKVENDVSIPRETFDCKQVFFLLAHRI